MPYKDPEQKRRYDQEYRQRHKHRLLEYDGKYRQEHREQVREIARKYANSPKGRSKIKEWQNVHGDLVKNMGRRHQKKSRDKLMVLWGRSKQAKQIEIDAVEELGCKILNVEGYETLRIAKHFPFDCLAKKIGESSIFAVDFTRSYRKEIKQHLRQLASFAGWQIMIVFIKPDFTVYRMIQVPSNLTGINILNTAHEPLNFKELPKIQAP